MDILISCCLSKSVKPRLVNWLPCSVLKISGQPYLSNAFSNASAQKFVSKVFDKHQERTLQLDQSIICYRIQKITTEGDIIIVIAQDIHCITLPSVLDLTFSSHYPTVPVKWGNTTQATRLFSLK